MANADRVIRTGPAKALGALMLLVVLASLSLLSAKALSVRVEYDEGYNMQIVESLHKGEGHATFGALRWGDPWKFDPHITTGPVALLPAAVAWSLADGSVTAVRALLLFFLWAYAAGWWLLLRQARVGLVVSGLALAPALAALAIGLAIQAKVVHGLAGVLMMAAWLFTSFASNERLRPRDVVLVALLAAAPSLLFEFFRLATYGSFEQYGLSIAEFRAFLAAQKASQWLDATMLGAKMSEPFGSYPTHA